MNSDLISSGDGGAEPWGFSSFPDRPVLVVGDDGHHHRGNSNSSCSSPAQFSECVSGSPLSSGGPSPNVPNSMVPPIWQETAIHRLSHENWDRPEALEAWSRRSSLDDGLMMDDGRPEQLPSIHNAGVPFHSMRLHQQHSHGFSGQFGDPRQYLPDRRGSMIDRPPQPQPHQLQAQPSFKDRNLQASLEKIAAFSDAMDLPASLKERAQELYMKVVDFVNLKNLAGAKRDGIVAACLYAACRQEGVARTFKEICSSTHVSKRDIGRCYKVILGAVETNVGQVSTENFMTRFCSKLGLSVIFVEAASHAARKAVEFDVVRGKGPLTVTAAAIHLVSKLGPEKRPLKKIAEVAGVAELTIRNCFKDLIRHIDTLLPTPMFQRANLDGEKKKALLAADEGHEGHEAPEGRAVAAADSDDACADQVGSALVAAHVEAPPDLLQPVQQSTPVLPHPPPSQALLNELTATCAHGNNRPHPAIPTFAAIAQHLPPPRHPPHAHTAHAACTVLASSHEHDPDQHATPQACTMPPPPLPHHLPGPPQSSALPPTPSSRFVGGASDFLVELADACDNFGGKFSSVKSVQDFLAFRKTFSSGNNLCNAAAFSDHRP